jgi:NAD(P)H-nitrite reductase large subunit
MNSLNYFGLDIAAAGTVASLDEDSCEVLSTQKDGGYQKVVLRDDLVVGMVFVQDIEKSGIVFGLMRDRINVCDFKQDILTDEFGLVSLPRMAGTTGDTTVGVSFTTSYACGDGRGFRRRINCFGALYNVRP